MARRESDRDNRSPDSGAAGEFKGVSRDVVIYEAERA